MSINFDKKLDFDSEFFDLYKLSESAYATIAKENSGMGGNAGFVDIGDYLIIVDTAGHINAAQDLKKAAIQYTHKEPNFIVLTHFHMDHLMGTSLFDLSTQIMTSNRTLKNIQTEGRKRLEEFKNMDLKELEESLKREEDEEKRKDIENDLFFFKTVRSDGFTIREPNLTFKTGCVIHGTEKNVHLRTFKKAHTDGDVVVYIPEEKVLFTGDLLFALIDPWLGSGDPEGWISVNEELITMDCNIIVPGHGNLASKESISLESKYIKEILEVVKRKIEVGEDPLTIKKEDLSKEFQSWKSPVFEWNINFLTELLKKS